MSDLPRAGVVRVAHHTLVDHVPTFCTPVGQRERARGISIAHRFRVGDQGWRVGQRAKRRAKRAHNHRSRFGEQLVHATGREAQASHRRIQMSGRNGVGRIQNVVGAVGGKHDLQRRNEAVFLGKERVVPVAHLADVQHRVTDVVHLGRQPYRRGQSQLARVFEHHRKVPRKVA